MLAVFGPSRVRLTRMPDRTFNLGAMKLLVKATARLPIYLPLWAFAKSRERASSRSAQRVASTEKKCERATEENFAIRPIDQERGSLLSVIDVPRFFSRRDRFPSCSLSLDSIEQFSYGYPDHITWRNEFKLDFMSFFLFYLIYCLFMFI